MKGVAIIAQRHTRVRCALRDLNVLVDVDNVFALGPNLHQHLVLAHLLHHLTYIRAWLLKQRQLLPQHAHWQNGHRSANMASGVWGKKQHAHAHAPVEFSSLRCASSRRRFF